MSMVLVFGTLVGLALAVPLGLMVAIYLSEFASPRARETIKPVLELLVMEKWEIGPRGGSDRWSFGW